MGAVLVISIAVRLLGLGLSLFFFARDRRWPILFLAALTGLMAARQILTLDELPVPWLAGAWPSELPGLAVSLLVLAIVVVYARILREDVRQYFFWNNVPRETGFIFADLEPDQTIRRVTANAAGMLGYDSAELVGRPFRALTAPDSPLTDLPAPDELEGLAEGLTLEATLAARDGRRIPVRVYARYLRNPLRGRRHYSLVLADRSDEVKSRQLQETIADLAREAEDIIANEGWGLVHIAERAAESLGVARINIWWFSPDRRFLRCAENFDRQSGQHTAGEVLEAANFPRYIEALESERTLAIHDPDSDPRAAELNREYLPAHDVTALLDAPLLVEGKVAGVVCFEHTGTRRRWTEVETAFAGSIADLVALARTAGMHRAHAEHLAHQAYLDPLTGLLNWQYLQDRLHEAVAEECRGGDPRLVLMYIDLDQFRYVNDTLGHSAGDRLLSEVAKELARIQPAEGLLGRVGGDEFLLLGRGLELEAARQLAEDIRGRLARLTFEEAGHQVAPSASIGLASLGGATASAGDLLAGADLACSQAKEAGRNQVAVYQPQEAPEALMSERMAMFHRIRQALDQDRFRLLFQPITGLAAEDSDLHEVLLRMEEGDGLLSPGEFLPTAERFSLMGEIDRWVVRAAVNELARRRPERPSLTLSVNLSPRSFDDQVLFADIRECIAEHGVDPAALVFEITETEAIANFDEAKSMIWTLRELGCRFSLDDFGSGFASFAYLRELPVDMVKIDGKFVRDLTTSTLDQAIVRALLDIARSLGKEVVAEYVEDGATADLLRDLGVHRGQGFHLGRPSAEPLPLHPAGQGSVGTG
ncbi:MAG TPA: EAL domain-containing protein [Gammaproteobacteria bacterium]|nr:EAL domain-containing protein [Gammaproteobacteria bacterium]